MINQARNEVRLGDSSCLHSFLKMLHEVFGREGCIWILVFLWPIDGSVHAVYLKAEKTYGSLSPVSSRSEPHSTQTFVPANVVLHLEQVQ